MDAPPSGSRYAALEERLGHRFGDAGLCETALTHKSWLNETHDGARRDNERLEFLGDAVIGLVAADLLMREYPRSSEGDLSKTRAALVNEEALARIGEQIDLGQWIFLGRGEKQAGGRHRRSILANTFEALLGAVFVDGGFAAARAVGERHLRPLLAVAAGDVERDYKSRLQELTQAALHVAPRYLTVAESGPAHGVPFEVVLFVGDREYGRGHGSSKQEAQQQAARQALVALERETAR
jgi:ribonuclease III